MRKFFLFLIPMLLPAIMLNAQQVQPSEKEPQTPMQKKMNYQLLHPAKAKRGQAVPDDIAASVTGNKTTSDKVPVDITCMVTPALVKIITDAGGEIISSSKENNIISAKVPAAALQKIATSADVKQISQSPAPVINPSAAKSEILKSNKLTNDKSFTRNFISETVLRSRKQGAIPVKTSIN